MVIKRVFSFIKSYRFYRFEAHLSNRFYRASINRFPLTAQNDTDHLSVSARVCLGPQRNFLFYLATDAVADKKLKN